MSSGQMSFWAKVLWADVLWGNVALGWINVALGKCLWGNVSGQMSYHRKTLNNLDKSIYVHLCLRKQQR
jgi:hypothetical protein